MSDATKSSGAKPAQTFYTIHFTGEGFRTLAIYRLFFKQALADVRAHQADYDAEVKAWYEENPGYQFPQCIHGSSLVTDYDNICGGCEDPDTDLERAIGFARERFLRFIDRWEWLTSAPGDLDSTTRAHIEQWTLSLFPKGV